MLITKGDFEPYIDVAANLSDKKLYPKIREAETFDICGLMGDEFYYDMMQWVNEDGSFKVDMPDGYRDLINGVTYDNTIVLPGLKPVDVYFSGARLIRSLDLHITPNSMAYKLNEYSERAGPKAIGMKATEYENQAIGYWRKCVSFIDFSGKDIFPLWNGFASCGDSEVSHARQRIIGVKGRSNNVRWINR